MCNLIEIHNIVNDTFLPKKSKPESDQASRSNQFIGTTETEEYVNTTREHDQQNPECEKPKKTNDPVSSKSSEALKVMGEETYRLKDLSDIDEIQHVFLVWVPIQTNQPLKHDEIFGDT